MGSKECEVQEDTAGVLTEITTSSIATTGGADHVSETTTITGEITMTIIDDTETILGVAAGREGVAGEVEVMVGVRVGARVEAGHAIDHHQFIVGVEAEVTAVRDAIVAREVGV